MNSLEIDLMRAIAGDVIASEHLRGPKRWPPFACVRVTPQNGRCKWCAAAEVAKTRKPRRSRAVVVVARRWPHRQPWGTARAARGSVSE
jgi:hypothetical protein